MLCVNGMGDTYHVPENIMRVTGNLQRALCARMEAESRLQCAEANLESLTKVNLEALCRLSHGYIRMQRDAPVPREVLMRMATIMYIREEMPRAERARVDARAALEAAEAALARATTEYQTARDALA